MKLPPRVLCTSLLCALLLPAAAWAQDRPMYELPTISVSILTEADPLYETAASLYQEGKWSEAATLHREAAEGMPDNSAASYLQFDQAARLYFYAGDFADARKMMEKAAEVAEATGDVEAAAYRHVDAAFIAVWEGYPGLRRDHVRMAEEYATSGNLNEEDADRIRALTRGVEALPVEEDS
jgi:tetratricopeptide (TPR) repeat protein